LRDNAGRQAENPDFVLNQPPTAMRRSWSPATISAAVRAREHAPWALLDQGIRCVISTSFADIFYNNCFKNGILPIKLPQAEVDKLMDDAKRGQNARFTVDLAKQEITRPDGEVIKFELDAHKKHCLLNGLDAIGLTLEKKSKIDSYETKQHGTQPWLYAQAGR
jgi:3-isopropylmalate/(R)-2-methylmalate dehydratase small subunit